MLKGVTAAASCLFLAACGGGGGGGGGSHVEPIPPVATPSPTPTPTPTNTTVRDLKVSQTFTNDAAGSRFVLDKTTGTGISGSAGTGNVAISYDAATNGYTISANGRTEAFGPTDVSESDAYDVIYKKASGEGNSYLTLIKQPYSGSSNAAGVSTRYVAQGYYQRIVTTADRQDTDFSTFTFGLPSVAAAVPKTGTAAFGIDAFGLVSKPGQEPRAFQGNGSFSVDFGAGIFKAHSYLTERSLVSDDSVVGGGIELTAGGSLSGNGSFGGNALYEGWFGAAGGTLSGRFYGPAAEEVGATFAGAGADGMAVAGGFTGQRDATLKPDNLTLTNLSQSQLFYTQWGYNSVGQLNWLNAETFTFSPPSSGMYGGTFTAADKVASSDPNFTTYRKTFSSSYDSQDVTLELFKPGSGNSKLALTYASFGHWGAAVPYGVGRTQTDLYFAYGLETPARLLIGKTGTGHYEGVLYGTASTSQTDARYAVTGSSRFDVDFTGQSLSGALSMTGASKNGGAGIDFGSFDFSGKLPSYVAGGTFGLMRGGQAVGQLDTRFYGPDGQEIAGAFSLNVPQGAAGERLSINGVTAATRR